MSTVVTVIVGALLLGWLLVAVATAVRLSRNQRHRTHARHTEDVPDGFVSDGLEPEGLRAPFALTAVGEVIDVPHAYRGRWQGREAAIADLIVRVRPGEEPAPFTVVVLEVEQRFPWTRLRPATVDAPDVADRAVDVADLAGRSVASRDWLLEGADETFVAELLGGDLLTWLGSLQLPLQVELVPRHLLVAVTGRLPSDDLTMLLGIATELSAHVPAETWQGRLPPTPEQEWEQA